MSAPAAVGVLAVAAREWRWIVSDRVARLLVVVIPLLAFALLAATFGNAVIRDLRVDVVDQDRSQSSQDFVRAINAAPGVLVAERSADLSGAMHAIRSGSALATVYIPRNLERDLLAGRRPEVVIFYNKQFFTPGNAASSSLQSALADAVARLQGSSAGRAYAPGPLVVEQYVLTNPALNYVQFLLRAILPTVLHVVVTIAAGYAVGSEFRRRSLTEWLATAGGSPLAAFIGKLIPYLCIFIAMMAVALAIIHGLLDIPFRGDPGMMVASACLLLLAYLCVGGLLQLLVKDLPTGLALAGIICSPAFGFAGVGFPALAMGGFAQAWGSILPLRWYIQILFDQAARGVPVQASAQPFICLAGLAALYFALAWLRLRAVARSWQPPAAETGPEAPPASGLVGSFVAEYRRVLRDRGVFGLIVMAPIIYGVFYPQPYLGQLVKDIPVAVVDDDNTDLSRRILQTLDAGEAVAVTARPASLAEAEQALARREVFGILNIPAGTQREVLKGNPARLPAFVDSAYFLLYSRTFQGIQEGIATVRGELSAGSARPDGSLARAALARGSPVSVLNQPLFNPTGGYGSYIVPAAFLLILQQTLMMGAATLGGVAFEGGGHGARRNRGAVTAVLGQGLAHLLLALPGFALYLVVLPRVYGFSASDHILDLLVLAIPFILSVSFLGQFVGSWFEHRETAVLLLIGISLPLFFLVGVAWPPEAMPPLLRSASFALPSTSGIDALVRANQMGAAFVDVFKDWIWLWGLAGLYAVLAILGMRWSGRREAPGG